MKNIKSQAGWTLWSMLFTMAVVGFFSYVGMNLVPVYSYNSNIKNAMKISVRDIDVRKATRSQIVKGMKAQLYIDSSASSPFDYKDDFKVVRDRNSLTISVEYDRVVPLFADISILVDFRPSLTCSLNGGCIEGTVQKKDE